MPAEFAVCACRRFFFLNTVCVCVCMCVKGVHSIWLGLFVKRWCNPAHIDLRFVGEYLE